MHECNSVNMKNIARVKLIRFSTRNDDILTKDLVICINLPTRNKVIERSFGSAAKNSSTKETFRKPSGSLKNVGGERITKVHLLCLASAFLAPVGS